MKTPHIRRKTALPFVSEFAADEADGSESLLSASCHAIEGLSVWFDLFFFRYLAYSSSGIECHVVNSLDAGVIIVGAEWPENRNIANERHLFIEQPVQSFRPTTKPAWVICTCFSFDESDDFGDASVLIIVDPVNSVVPAHFLNVGRQSFRLRPREVICGRRRSAGGGDVLRLELTRSIHSRGSTTLSLTLDRGHMAVEWPWGVRVLTSKWPWNLKWPQPLKLRQMKTTSGVLWLLIRWTRWLI